MRAVFKKENLYLFAGVVSSDVQYFFHNGSRCALVVLMDRTNVPLRIIFRDKDRRNITDRIHRAKVRKGSYISVLATGYPDNGVAIGLDFKFEGLWIFKDPNGGKDTTILQGTVHSPHELKDGMFTVTIPVKTLPPQRNVIWYDVTFFNSYNGSLNADTAKRLLKANTDCCIRGGQIYNKVAANGKIYQKITGFGIDLRPV